MENKVIIPLILVILVIPASSGLKENNEGHILIYEVSPYSYSGEHLEYVCIVNPTNQKINLSSYYLTDFEGYLLFRGTIDPGEKIYIAENATSFRSVFGFYPDYTYNEIRYNGSFALGNSGDEVALIHSGYTVDIVIYGNSDYKGAGWRGKPLNVSQGHILRRKGYVDTDAPDDWTNYHRIGQSDFKEMILNSSVELLTFPDDRDELFRFLSLAHREIIIESYTASNNHFGEILEKKLNSGVHVRMLLEGNPVGGITEEEKYLVERIYKSGGEIYFMISGGRIHNRYTYVHSKFIVIDSKYALISTENFDEKSISPCGNRGYGIIIWNERIAKYLKSVFEDDVKNVTDIKRYDGEFGDINMREMRSIQIRSKIFGTINITAHISLVLAPDYSVEEFDKFVDGQKWLDVESLYIKDYALSEVYGKSKRILVNYVVDGYDMKKFNGDKKLLRMLHAKLMIGDSAVLVGSMNFGYSSMTRNRELSVIIESEYAVKYFEKVFNYDWSDYIKPIALMIIRENGDRITVDLSESEGKIREYRIYIDGKMVYHGKDAVREISLNSGTHKIKAEIIDTRGNVDSVEAVITVKKDMKLDTRWLIIGLLFAVFLYKVWKNHR